jgi:hypothetical protein
MNDPMVPSNHPSLEVRVVVAIQFDKPSLAVFIDPWDNCPSEEARDEGCQCQECEFWGQEVWGVDWHEFSLCKFPVGETPSFA